MQVVRDYEARKARIEELSNAINKISDRASLIRQKMYPTLIIEKTIFIH